MKRFLSFLLLLAAAFGAYAQDNSARGIPDSVYYLMPSFGDGIIYFRGQTPAQGKLNICAVDNSLRFLDKNGKELSATQADNIVKVRIDTVMFLRSEDVFYRMFPVTDQLGVALRKEVKIKIGEKQGAFGTTSQTSSIRQYNSVYADGALYDLENGKTYPYEVSESICLYKGDTVFPLTKKNLKKLFPSKKEEIETWSKAGNELPQTVDQAVMLLQGWAN